MKHTQEKRAGAAGGVKDFERGKHAKHRFRIAKQSGVIVIDETAKRIGFSGKARRKKLQERLLAHKTHDGGRRVEHAFLFALFADERFKDLAEHFGVNSNINIERRIFGDRKGIAIEETENGFELVVGKCDAVVKVFFIKQAAVEKRNVPDERMNFAGGFGEVALVALVNGNGEELEVNAFEIIAVEVESLFFRLRRVWFEGRFRCC